VFGQFVFVYEVLQVFQQVLRVPLPLFDGMIFDEVAQGLSVVLEDLATA